jgi:hypothetical protein
MASCPLPTTRLSLSDRIVHRGDQPMLALRMSAIARFRAALKIDPKT